jgi:MFS family permease
MITDAYAALKQANFRYFVGAHFIFTVALLTQEVVLSFYLYNLTHDPLSLGLIGLAEAVPFIVLALFGGYLADKIDRRKLYLSSFSAVALISLFLAIYLTKTTPNIRLDPFVIYSSVLGLGIARGFYNPAWSSLKPYLVASKDYSNSASWSAQFWQLGRIIGPVLGGFLYAFIGLSATLYVVFGLFVFTFLVAFQIPSMKVEAKENLPIFQSIKEGIAFVRKTHIVFYSLLLDMLSVLFGGVIAILPAFAKDILNVGPEGLGILRAAPAIGAVLTMLLTAYFPPTKKAWKNMLIAVLGFGVATLVFAFSENFYLSIFALFFTGVFDSISVVVRSTIMQIIPPTHMRGRISSVNSIFVSTSNELGAFESGLAASMLGLVPSVLLGAGVTLIIVGITYLNTKDLFGIDLTKLKRVE